LSFEVLLYFCLQFIHINPNFLKMIPAVSPFQAGEKEKKKPFPPE